MAPAANLEPSETLSAALADAYEAHFDFVWRSLRRLGVPADMLEDAVQDVFVVAAKKIEQFEGRAKLRTWLFAIAQRVAQRKRRDRFRHLRRNEAVAAEHQHAPRQDDTMAAKDAADTLSAMLDQLDDAQRLVFVLVEAEGMTAVEVAASLETNVNTVYSRLRSARKKMQALAAQLAQSDRSTSDRQGGPR